MEYNMQKEVQDKNKGIVLEIALSINQELFNENKISYKAFKCTEENILKQIRSNYKNINM